jgi:integrase
MSVYFIRRRGWRFDFTLNGIRYTGAWFKTKAEAKNAESKKREEVKKPKIKEETPIGMGFLDLVNKRLDHIKAYNSLSHYKDHVYMAKRWVKAWGKMDCDSIARQDIKSFILKRSRVSSYTANHDLRCLRSLFNFGIKEAWVSSNPTLGIPFLPVEKKIKYIPSKEDALKVIITARADTKDYLLAIQETIARVGEINRLTWSDVNLVERYVILYTRKKKGGNLIPRKVPMTNRLYQALSHRHEHRDKGKPWVFWHRYWSRKTKEWVEGPYKDRKLIMKTLCKKAGVKYFRFHPLRHLGASILDHANVNIGSIQRILGHENRTTTEIYLHSIGESEREAMEIFEKVSHDSHTETGKELSRVA